MAGQDFLNGAHDLVQDVRPDGTLAYVNRAWRESLGYGPHQIAGLTIDDIIHPDHVPTFRRWIEHAGAGEQLCGLTTVFRAADGQAMVVEGHLRGRVDKRGRWTARGVFRDLTDQRPAELDCAGLFEVVSDMICVLDRNGTCRGASSTLSRNLGFSVDELVQQPFADLVHPDDRPAVAKVLDRLWRGGDAADLTCRCRCQDGTARSLAFRWVRPHAAAEVVYAIASDAPRKNFTAPELTHVRAPLESILDASTQLSIIATDLHGKITVFNSGAERMLGYTAEEVIGRHTPALFHLPAETADRGRELSREWEQTIAGFDVYVVFARAGRFERREWTYVKKDGSHLTVSLVVTAVRDEFGKVTGFLGIAEDITHRKQTEEAMARLASIVETSDDAIISASIQSHITTWNAGAERLFGYAASEVIGQHITKFFTEDQHAEFHDLLAKLARGERVIGYETHGFRKDGQRVVISITASPLMNRDGKITGFSSITRDITEQKRLQQRFATAVEASPAALLMTDHEGRIMLLNSQCERLFGYTREEMIDQTVELLVPDGLRGRHIELRKEFFAAPVKRAIGGGVELPARRKDGSQFPAEIGLCPVDAEEGMQVLCAIVDITERRQAMRELQQAKEAAEAASQAKSEFLANMSHEIRTPMNGIIGMTELTLRTRLTSEQRENLEMVRRSADSLLMIIDDILDFSKVEAGKLELDDVRFGLRDTIVDALKTLAARAHEKNLELAWQVATDVPDALCGGQQRLRQILLNLVGNAIKFTERGEILVSVRQEAQRDNGRCLRISVADTGVGIPRHQVDSIFEAFTQGDPSLTRGYGGTGLGLAICSRLARLMGGRVWVESEPGAGSEFCFTAWFKSSADRMSEQVSATISTCRGKRILVVDDNATQGKILAAQLAGWDMLPSHVANAIDADERVASAIRSGRSFDLILLDAHMPRTDGFTLAHKWSQQGDFPAPLVLMLHAMQQDADLQRCRELGVRSHLVKPFTHTELLAAMAAALKQPTQASEDSGITIADRETKPSWRPRILVAEDNSVNQRLMQQLLRHRGYEARIVSNGEEAVRAFADQACDLVLMDVQMPGLDGFDATCEIRRMEQHTGGHIPIIAMTAYAMKGDRERCLAAGMDGYISKPIDAVALFSMIDEFSPYGEFPPHERDEGMPEGRAADVFDLGKAVTRVVGNVELLRELAQLFLLECPRIQEQLERAVADHDVSQIKFSTHRLKSSVANFFAHQVLEALIELEASCGSEDWLEVGTIYGRFQQAWEAFIPVLSGFAHAAETSAAPQRCEP